MSACVKFHLQNPLLKDDTHVIGEEGTIDLQVEATKDQKDTVKSPAAWTKRHMKIVLAIWFSSMLIWTASIVLTLSQNGSQSETAAGSDSSHDFDFLIGNFRVHHQVKRPDQSWLEFDGTTSQRAIMGGEANVQDYVFIKPDGISRAVAIRAYDRKTKQWAIWWIDGRDPAAALDPPMKGGFVNGVGTFYSASIHNGRPARIRFIWSNITPTSARWEQAYSFDAGKSWETNWIMTFTRNSAAVRDFDFLVGMRTVHHRDLNATVQASTWGRQLEALNALHAGR